MNEDIPVHYQFGPGNSTDWIGIYKDGDIPGQVPSTDWAYVTGDSGTVTLSAAEAGKYFIGFFEEDGYSELSDRVPVYIISKPVLTLNKAGYATGERIIIDYLQAPGLPRDWIGIYGLNNIPGAINSTAWEYTSGTSGSIEFSGLPSGYYFVCYFLEDGYTEACERTIFSVGTDLANIRVDRPTYSPGQTISVTFQNGPGTTADWVGILRQNAPAGTAPLVDRKFTDNQISGIMNFDIPDAGDYYAALFINNSGTRISNKALFTVEQLVSDINKPFADNDIIIFPSPSRGMFTIRLPGSVNDGFSLSISSLTGIQVMKEKYDTQQFSMLDIDMTKLAPGVYVISIQTTEKSFTKKIVIQ
jgi:hypothetical protein